jgi:ribosome-associated toxin RatA of RatAB toxin-antitoxin module
MKLALAAALLAGGLGLGSPAAADDAPLEVVQVGPRTYRARGAFVVAASHEAAWEAITDYEGIPRLAPSMKSSRVLRRDGHKVLVEQEAVASAFFFTKQLRMLLEIAESPPRKLVFRDVARRDFARYEGFWTIDETPDGLRVSYGLDVERGFPAPDFLARPFLRTQGESLMRAMRDDILRRAASSPR